jgi:glycerophosphoryl diester phosphodiesterase
MVRALLAEIDKAGMADRVTVQSFDWRTLALVASSRRIQRAYLRPPAR